MVGGWFNLKRTKLFNLPWSFLCSGNSFLCVGLNSFPCFLMFRLEKRKRKSKWHKSANLWRNGHWATTIIYSSEWNHQTACRLAPYWKVYQREALRKGLISPHVERAPPATTPTPQWELMKLRRRRQIHKCQIPSKSRWQLLSIFHSYESRLSHWIWY